MNRRINGLGGAKGHPHGHALPFPVNADQRDKRSKPTMTTDGTTMARPMRVGDNVSICTMSFMHCMV